MSKFPALEGDVVTEAHARICRERGHAFHTIDGVDTGCCPRCGVVTENTLPRVDPNCEDEGHADSVEEHGWCPVCQH